MPSRHAGHIIVAPRDTRRVVMTWLHHRSYGTLGVYLTDAPGDLRVLLPARQWIQARGIIQPWLVHAQSDDPRSAIAPQLTPLVVALTALEIIGAHISGAAPLAAPLLPRPQHVRLLPGRRCGRGYLAPIHQQPDLSYWQTGGTAPPLIATWNRIVGVVSAIKTDRYLRYVVSARPERQRKR